MRCIQKTLASNGIEVYAQTPSYINAFSRLNHQLHIQEDKLQILVSCNPEYGAKQGHFIDYEKILNTYCQKQGIRHIIFNGLTAESIDEPKTNTSIEKIHAFPKHLSPPQQDSSYDEFAQSCISAIRRLTPSLPGNSNIIIFFYLSSFRFLDKLFERIEKIKLSILPNQKISFIINGFWDSHMMPDKLNRLIMLKA